jgi:hypothetical protein
MDSPAKESLRREIVLRITPTPDGFQEKSAKNHEPDLYNLLPNQK